MSFCNYVIILFMNEDVIKFKNLDCFDVLKVDDNDVRKSNKVSRKYKALVRKLSSLLLDKFIRHSYKKRKVNYPHHFRQVRRYIITEYSLKVTLSVFFYFT